MIRRLFAFVMMALLVCGGAVGEELPPLVRLHVLAEDDSAGAQALKMELRDVCLRCAGICLADAEDADAAYMRLQEHAGDFQSACALRARELGYDGEIRAETGVFEFPDRVYGDVQVPAGEYRALRIIIGEGEGRNWWCVLYPGLCMEDAEAAPDEGSAYSRVLEWLRARFGGAA